MTDISRFGVSIPADLLDKFDSLVESEGYTNRSKAIADIIRDYLIASAWDEAHKSKKKEVVGIVTMIYDHHVPNLVEKLLNVQHSAGTAIYSTMHIHLDHHNCLEIMALKGQPAEIKKFADSLQAVRGVKDTKLVMTGLD